MKTATIRDWSIIGTPNGRDHILTGIVEGHPNCFDGERIYTSPIKAIDPAASRVHTRNTIYTLIGESLVPLDTYAKTLNKWRW